MRELSKVALFTKEYPPHVYGGAGVHVEYLAAALAKRAFVEVRCFGDQRSGDGANPEVRGYPQWDETARNTDPRFVGAVDAYARSLAMAKDRLDADVAVVLVDMGVPVDFTEAQYEEAYRRLDNYDERLFQIELIIESLEFTHRVSQMTLIGVVLKSARLATGLFSKDRAVELLERAYSMLRHIKDIGYLVGEIRTREVARLDRIYAR